MKQLDKATLEVQVETPAWKTITNAKVTATRDGDEKAKPVSLKFSKETERYHASDIAPGRYVLQADAPRMQGDERTVVIGAGAHSERFVLGRKGMPFYYRGAVKVPFDPRPARLAVAISHAAQDDEFAKLKALIKQLELSEEEDTPDEIRKERVAVYRHPDEGEAVDAAIARLRAQPGVAAAGLVLNLEARVVEFMTSQINVRFKAEVSNDQVPVVAERRGLRVVRRLPYSPNGWLLEVKSGASRDVLEICAELVKSGLVIYAEPNLSATAPDQAINPTDYLRPEQWHIDLVNLPDAWQTLHNNNAPGVNPGDPGDLTFGSEDIVIAVLDRGIQSTTVGGVTTAAHADFDGTVTGGASKVAHFIDFNSMTLDNDSPPNNHGMGCSGVAGGLANNPSGVGGVTAGIVGAAPNCRMIGAIRPSPATAQQYADAFVWLAGFDPGWTGDGVNYTVGTVFPAPPANPADLISCSFGWSSGPLAGVMSDTFDFVTTYGRGGRGVGVFWAAGNVTGVVQVDFATALHPKVMCVGASTLDNDGTTEIRSAYSQIGNSVEFVAPSHDAYVGGAPLHNPPANYGVISADLLGNGNMPGAPFQSTSTTGAVTASAANVTLSVGSSAGFAAGQAALIGVPGAADTEAQLIVSIPSGTQIRVQRLHNDHPAGTAVAGGPADYQNDFGGTSSATPLAAGIAALCLSANSALSWVELRQIMRLSATQIDLGNSTATGAWIDTTGDGTVNFSQWYGWGRLNADAAVIDARDYGHASDVVIRDNLTDVGTTPSPGWHAVSPDIWTDPNDVAIPALAYGAAPPHFNPVRGQPNYVFVRVKNIGTAATSDFWVRAMITHFPGFEFRYPQEWMPSNMPGSTVPSPLVPGTYLIGETAIASLAPGADQIVKMTWDAALVPESSVMVGGISVHWHPCLLAEAAPHDGPAPSGATFDVRRYNDLAQRNITIDDDSDSSDADLVSAVIAGTSDAGGIDSVILDRSQLPGDYRVFARIADDRLMAHWIAELKAGGIHAVDPLPGSTQPVPPHPDDPADQHPGDCIVTLLDPARLAVRCGTSGTLIVHGAPKTQFEFRCGGLGVRPRLSIGRFQGQEVVYFDQSAPAIALPTQLAGGQYMPLVLGISRPEGRRGQGTLRATQRRADGGLSAGYAIDA
ncbi:S8 family serine peptidase [Arenibacterium sp. CAU 1754]